ncbi:MAG: DUF99 domain-containing protein [Candidatus Nitrosopolaris wilkensis]|nr:MAG: DUF99 domain-containing protein [Candidatus Nitrosopolaris wilkensis]
MPFKHCDAGGRWTRFHAEKKGIRVFGIAESLKKSCVTSTLAGVVMRRDLIIDGMAFGTVTIRGNDSTQNILTMIRSLKRNDVNCIMLDGLIISMYNIIHGEEIREKTGVPVIAITFKDSQGLEGAIQRHFPNDSKLKLEQYRNLGQREQILLKTGKFVFLRYWGLSSKEASAIVNSFTLQGSIPEPIRIAKLVARASNRRSSR